MGVDIPRRPGAGGPRRGAERKEISMAGKLKHKTRKAVAKRFKRTKRGKILYTATHRGHLLAGKSRKRKRQLRAGGQLTGGERLRVLPELPR